MSAKQQSTQGYDKYVVLEVGDEVTITLKSGDVFKSKRYRLSTMFATAFGCWVGGSKNPITVMMPISSIDHIQVAAKQVPKDQALKTGNESVKQQVETIETTHAEAQG